MKYLQSLITFLSSLLNYSANCQLRRHPQFHLSERVRVTLRPAVYCQSVRIQLNPCGHSPYVTSSLTRGWVCRLQLLLVLTSRVILGPSPADLITILYCLRFETPQTWMARSPCYIPQEQGGAVIPPCTGFPFHRPLRFAGLRWRYTNSPSRVFLVI
jgi:hypothetical protein